MTLPDANPLPDDTSMDSGTPKESRQEQFDKTLSQLRTLFVTAYEKYPERPGDVGIYMDRKIPDLDGFVLTKPAVLTKHNITALQYSRAIDRVGRAIHNVMLTSTIGKKNIDDCLANLDKMRQEREATADK